MDWPFVIPELSCEVDLIPGFLVGIHKAEVLGHLRYRAKGLLRFGKIVRLLEASPGFDEGLRLRMGLNV